MYCILRSRRTSSVSALVQAKQEVTLLKKIIIPRWQCEKKQNSTFLKEKDEEKEKGEKEIVD